MFSVTWEESRELLRELEMILHNANELKIKIDTQTGKGCECLKPFVHKFEENYSKVKGISYALRIEPRNINHYRNACCFGTFLEDDMNQLNNQLNCESRRN